MKHNKTLHLVIITAALLSLLLVSTAYSNSVYAQNKFRAKLDANNEVPPVDSTAKGVATFKIKEDAIKSKINITGLAEVAGAQIFMGKIGQNEDPIVDLIKTGEKTKGSDRVVIKGNFTASDFEGSLKGKDLSALQSAMAGNQTYVNIMTTAHPDGEITGHIYAKGSTSGAQDTGTSDTVNGDNEASSEDGTADESENIGAGDNED
jgi:hypothetical protein